MAAAAVAPPELDLVPPANLRRSRLPARCVDAPATRVPRPLDRAAASGDSYWAITKHADIMHIGKNPAALRQRARPLFVEFEDRTEGVERFETPPTLIAMDPPKHGKYRKLISKRFTPRAHEEAMHGDIERIAKKIVDDLLESGDEGTVDFVEKVVRPAPHRGDRLASRRTRDPTGSCSSTGRTAPSARAIPEYQKDGEDGEPRPRNERDDRAVHLLHEARRGEEARTRRTTS